MVDRGLLRRVAAILFHRRAGFSANGMGVWQVPDEHIAEVGPRMAAYRGISHCYQRPTYADWRYSIFTMAHGRSKEECDAILDAIAADNPEIQDRATLYSSTEFKKIRLLYFTDDFKAWEREHTRGLMAVSLTDARSTELYARALQRLPGGVNSPVRAMGAIGRNPVFIERGHGAELIDVDGNRYVDYVCSWGPLILGHAHPAVVAAVVAAAERGTTFGAPTQGEVDLADEIARRMPSVEMVRMTSSGTEATMSAIRLARAATGREKILKFAGAYHGHVDGLLAQAGSGLATAAIPASPGVPEAATAATVVVPWNDAEAVRRATEEHELAAILAEPFAANMGLVAPADGFLDLLRERASATGALLVFDEVITGFRVARGGAQELAGVMPDLTVMGKVIGGGLPAAAYGGPRELMELVAPAGDVYQAGTLSGNPLAVAAGLADAAAARRGRLRLPDRPHRDAGRRPARGRGRPARARRDRPRPAHRLLLGRARARLRGRPGVRPRRLRGLVPRTARPRRLRAAVAVRGVVPVAGARRRARRAHGRRRRRGLPGGVLALSLAAVHAALLAEGGLLADALGPAPAEDGALGAAAASGPRSSGREADIAFVVEAIREGELLHYGAPRLFGAIEPDLALLAGDRLYALGLARLARLGDVEAVSRAGRRHRAVRPGARRRPPGAGRRGLAGGRGRGRLGPSGRRSTPPRPRRGPAILARRTPSKRHLHELCGT